MAVQGSVLSQASYKGTPYADAEWEIVGEVHFNDDFVPMEVEVLKEKQLKVVVDPMFADFGGLGNSKAAKRWHLPEHLAAESAIASRNKEQEGEQKKTTLTDDEIAQIRQQAFSEGHQAGLDEASRQYSEKISAIDGSLKQVFSDLNKQLNENLRRTEVQAVDLSLNIAKKIIDGAVEINPEYIVRIIKEALGLAGGAAVHKIRVSPQDMEFIDVVGLTKHLKEHDGSWQFEADTSIRAGCVVETSAGQIDYQIDAAWDRLKESVIKVTR